MTTREALLRAMNRSDDVDPAERLRAEGLAVVDVSAMCKAVHEVYCGRLADHSEPNEKDLEQARALMSALQMTAADQMTV